ncbi:ACP phosphodiesterase [Aquitalea magnusonii]|uniref:Acyl carrier protein phosphodiesterase n=1 Tax=Aquitalea magnusonii TaxID=332411 RepID=A0A318IXG8_9NEIS|nr:ACP phosphodiesterase [Aquitalea magnusonii]PXX40159.1 acyl carrier protein phosphodiesterase [Aquitalea magnusonii]
MNYLAHLQLAPDDASARVGNLLGDFIKPAHAGHLPPSLQQGMALHRQIDSYTDSHPLVLQSKTRIAAERRRYAGILVDIFYDHFLARHWDTFASLPLAAFTRRSYAELQQHRQWLPPRLLDMLPRMQAEDWLGSYAETEGIAAVLRGFSRHRIRRDNPVATGIDDLLQQYTALEADFLAFYPQLQQAVAQRIGLAMQ